MSMSIGADIVCTCGVWTCFVGVGVKLTQKYFQDKLFFFFFCFFFGGFRSVNYIVFMCRNPSLLLLPKRVMHSLTMVSEGMQASQKETNMTTV